MTNKQEELISVIIPMYNAEEYIEYAIHSVIVQTYSNLEIIILDNCSTDKSFDIVSRIQDNRIRLIKNEQNIGLNGSVNKGIDLAKGAYIKFLCADDALEPNCIEEAYSQAKSKNVDLIYLNCRYIDSAGNRIQGKAGTLRSMLLQYEAKTLQKILIGKYRLMPCITSVFVANYNLPYFRNVKGSTYHSDFLFLFDCFKSVGKLFYDSEPMTQIRHHEKQGTYSNLRKDIFEGPLLFINEICDAHEISLSTFQKIFIKFKIFKNAKNAFIKSKKSVPTEIKKSIRKYFCFGYEVLLWLYLILIYPIKKIRFIFK